MTTQNPPQHTDLFFEPIVDGYLSNPRFVPRDWLAEEIGNRLNAGANRFVLLTAEPGFGKSAFVAQLAGDHPDWLRYFIRRDQREPLGDVDARSFLLRVGFQLAARYPEVFTEDAIRLSVEQRVDDVSDRGSVVGVEIGKIVASPFHEKTVQIQQQLGQVEGKVTGLHIDELVVDPSLLNVEDLQRMALIDPAHALRRLYPERQIVILVDALDEVRYHQTENNIVTWLANCPDLPPNVRFVLTSRPPDGAVSLFIDKQQRGLKVLAMGAQDRGKVALWSDQVDKDLEAYIDRLVSDTVIKTHLDGWPGGASGFRQQAVAKADGNIGYLDALARAIDQAMVNNDNQTLAALFTVKSLPDDMQGLYAFFLHQIKQSLDRQRIELEDSETGETYDKPVWPAVHSRLLGVLAVVREPVTLEQIKFLGTITAGWADLNAAKDSLLQFLDVVDNRYRLYHPTLPEFLTDVRTRGNAGTEDLYVDAGEWHKRIGDRYRRSYNQDWSHCDTYGLRYTPFHLAQATLALDRTEERLKHTQLLGALTKLLTDYRFLEARMGQFTIYAVLSDMRETAGLLPELTRPDGPIQLLLSALDLEANSLASWRPAQRPALLAQQLYNRTRNDRNMSALTAQCAQRLADIGNPYFEIIWSARRESAVLVRVLDGHEGPVNALAMTSDEQVLVSGGDDGMVVIWDLTTGRPSLRLEYVQGKDYDWELRQRDVTARDVPREGSKSGIDIQAIQRERSASAVNALAMYTDDQRVLVGLQTGRIEALDLQTGVSIEPTLIEKGKPVFAMALSPDGRYLVAIIGDRLLLFYNVPKGSVQWLYPDHDDETAITTAVSWSSNLVLLAISGQQGNRVEAVDPATLHTMLKPGSHQHIITGIAAASSGTLAVTADADGLLKVWDLVQGREVSLTQDWELVKDWGDSDDPWYLNQMWQNYLMGRAVLPAMRSPPTADLRWHSVALSPDGHFVVTGLWDGRLHVWDLTSMQRIGEIDGHRGAVRALLVSPSGQYAVSAAEDGKIKVWDMGGPVEHEIPEGHHDWVNGLIFTPDGRRLVSGSDDGTIRLWDAKDGKELLKVAAHDGWVLDFAFAADGRTLYSAGGDGTIKSWDMDGLAPIHTFKGHKGRVHGVSVTSEGELISVGADSEVKVWNTATGEVIHTLHGHKGKVIRVAPIPGRRQVVSTSEDKTLRVWDLESGKEVCCMHGHEAQVDGVVVTPDGRQAISASYDMTVRVWNLASGECDLVLQGHQAAVYKVALSAAGAHVFSVSADRTVRAWTLATGEEVAMIPFQAEASSIASDPQSDVIIVSEATGNLYLLRMHSP